MTPEPVLPLDGGREGRGRKGPGDQLISTGHHSTINIPNYKSDSLEWVPDKSSRLASPA